MQKCIEELSPFATRDSAQKLDEAKALSRELALGLLQCNALAPCFDLLRRLVEIDEGRLEELYQEGFATGSNVARFVTAVCEEYEDRLEDLSRKDHVALNQIADLVVLNFVRLRSNLEADPKSQVAFSLCYNPVEQRFKTPDELKGDVVALFNRIFDEIGKTFRSPQVGLKGHLMRVLRARENTTEGLGDILRLQVELMSQMLSEFNLYLGANLLPNKAALSELNTAKTEVKAAAVQTATVAAAAAAPAAFGGEDDLDDFSDLAGLDDENNFGAAPVAPVTPAAPVRQVAAAAVAAVAASADSGFELSAGQSVLGTAEGPVNCFVKEQGMVRYDPKREDHTVFSRTCTLDETGLLPHLDAVSADYEFKFLSDFAATLGYMMCQVNVSVQSKYQFSSEENFLLCAILQAMEELK